MTRRKDIQAQALPWIKVWTAVGRHPKLQRLERELGLPDGLGLVVRLWCWTADYHPGGEIPAEHADTAMAAAIGDLKLEASRVTQSCVTCGFLDKTDAGFRVHDWHEMQTVHVEAMEKRRAQARERQQRLRDKRNATEKRDVTRDITRDVRVTSPSPSPSPSPSTSRSLSSDGRSTETVPSEAAFAADLAAEASASPSPRSSKRGLVPLDEVLARARDAGED